jgi:hypothetical protein
VLGRGDAGRRRPFEVRRHTAQPEVEQSDSSPRVRAARSGPAESAMSVYAAMDVVGITSYSRREREDLSGATLPGVLSRTSRAGIPTTEYQGICKEIDPNTDSEH